MKLQKEFDLLVSEHIDGQPSVHSTQRLTEIMKKNPRFQREFTDQIMIHNLLTRHAAGLTERKRAVLDKEPGKTVFPKRRTGLMERILAPFSGMIGRKKSA